MILSRWDRTERQWTVAADGFFSIITRRTDIILYSTYTTQNFSPRICAHDIKSKSASRHTLPTNHKPLAPIHNVFYARGSKHHRPTGYDNNFVSVSIHICTTSNTFQNRPRRAVIDTLKSVRQQRYTGDLWQWSIDQANDLQLQYNISLIIQQVRCRCRRAHLRTARGVLCSDHSIITGSARAFSYQRYVDVELSTPLHVASSRANTRLDKSYIVFLAGHGSRNHAMDMSLWTVPKYTKHTTSGTTTLSLPPKARTTRYTVTL